MSSVKVFGERHCGTHLLEELVRLNTDASVCRGVAPARLQRLLRSLPSTVAESVTDCWFRRRASAVTSWKHGRLDDGVMSDLEGTCVVAIVKHPLAWALSMFAQPYHATWELASTVTGFVEAPWTPRWRDRASVERYPDLFALWNDKATSYIRAQQGGVEIVRYEDVLASPDVTLGQIFERWNLRRSGAIQFPAQPVKPGGRTADAYRSYYLAEEWREALPADYVARWSSRFPPVAFDLGYTIDGPPAVM